MGHDIHFLERLERLAGKHLEGALALYRDPEFVKMVLHEAKIADGADRIALSLNDIQRGPFVIVTRSGRFVTCLAEGMSIGAHTPVVAREKLDKLLARMSHFRERMAEWNRMVDRVGGVMKLWNKFLRGGYLVSREEFVAMSGTAPMLQDKLWDIVFSSGKFTLETINKILTSGIDRRIDRPDEQLYDVARQLWFATWRGTHCAVLASMDGNIPSRARVLINPRNDLAFIPGISASFMGLVPQIIRMSWVTGRLGKQIFKDVKSGYLHAQTFSMHAAAISQLWGIGMRNPKLTAQVHKVLDQSNPFFDEIVRIAPNKPLAEEGYSALGLGWLRSMESDQSYAIVKGHLWDMAPPMRDHFSTAENIPNDIVATWLSNYVVSINTVYNRWKSLTAIPVALTARQPPELMYWEEKWLRVFSDPWKPEMALEKMLRPWFSVVVSPNKTPNSAPKIARNDPCHCGSGKKYKKCCGK